MDPVCCLRKDQYEERWRSGNECAELKDEVKTEGVPWMCVPQYFQEQNKNQAGPFLDHRFENQAKD